ncbi:MAG: hypothetical protein JXJ22_02230 [Bacteroidales bacterium]|nr:hypothetical protein [Bacteroidales bacterium]
MKKKIGLFLIHGAGDERFRAQDKFIQKLFKKLEKLKIDSGLIAWRNANWYAPTQNEQVDLYNRFLSSHYPVKAKKLRQFVLYLISDMVAYVSEPNKPSKKYAETHALIHRDLALLKDELEENAPLILMASSLGTTIISNYIQDIQNKVCPEIWCKSPFERFETLTNIIMLGNNIPIYAPAYNLDQLTPFLFPNEKLSETFKPVASWLNIYDKNDPLGFPLKPINVSFEASVIKDIEMNVGGLLTSWNIGSHMGYWKSKKVIEQVSGIIRNIYKLVK